MCQIIKKTKVIQILTGIFIIFLISIIIIVNIGLGPVMFPFVDEIPGGDKIAHFVLIGFLSLFVNLSMKVKTITLHDLTMLKGSFIVSIMVIVEELSQIFLIHRGFELLDLTFDAAGILVFGKLAQHLYSVFCTNTSSI